MIIVDASVVMKLLTREVGSAQAVERVLNERERTAPDWLQVEIASALSKKVRNDGLAADAARKAFAALPLIMPDLAPSAPLLGSAMELSIELSHAVYDCLYLALAIEAGGKMLTADRKFFAATQLSSYKHRMELLA